MWGQSDTILKQAGKDAALAGTIPCFYDAKGGSLTVPEWEEPNATESVETDTDTQPPEVVADVAIIALGTCGSSTAMTYILKSKSYVDLMYKIHTGRTRGGESIIRYYSVDDPSAVSCKVPASPESGWYIMVAKCRDGGFAAGAAALCTFLGILVAGLLGSASVTWLGVCVPFFVMFLGFAVGVGAHFIYCRMVVPVLR